MTSTQTAEATSQQTKEYVSCADTAVELRKALKAQYPSVKFSVRSKVYSGGASIDVKWTDGPTTDMVDLIAQQFAGATFDGMIDLMSYHTSTYQGRLIHWGADFVFTNRHASPALIEKAARYLEVKFGLEFSINRETWYNDYREVCNGGGRYWDVSSQMHQTLAKMHETGNLVTIKNRS